MAVWQFKLTVIPKESVIHKFSVLPKVLNVDPEYRRNFWDTTKDLESCQNSKFKDAFTINWWANLRISIFEMIPQVDAIIKGNKWERNNFISWKADEENHQDHDVFISFDEVTKIIQAFNFRTDLRDTSFIFLGEMLKICDRYDCLVMDQKGNLSEPSTNNLEETIVTSDAVRFITNPPGFLKDVIERSKKE